MCRLLYISHGVAQQSKPDGSLTCADCDIQLCALLLLQQQQQKSVAPRVGQGIQQHTQHN